jgi:hypothetical protein
MRQWPKGGHGQADGDRAGPGKLALSGNGVKAVRARSVSEPETMQLLIKASGKQRRLNRPAR